MTTIKTTKKRGSGEGSWKHLGNNKWKVTITVGIDINGKQVRRSKTGTKRECQEWFKQCQEASSNSDFYDYAMQWLELKKPSLSPSTIYNLKLKIKVLARINNFKMSRCTDKEINKIIVELSKTRSRSYTIILISVLKNILRYAKDKNDIKAMPYIPKIPQTYQKKEIKIPSIQKIKELLILAKYRKDYIYPCILLGFLTGMRLGEILALTREDIDVNNCTITINKTYSITEIGKVSIKQGAKNLTSNRTIYVNPKILTELVKSSFTLEGNIIGVTKYVKRGNTASQGITRFFKNAAMNNFTMHFTRHTFITLAQEYGVDSVFVSQYVGHSLATTTFKVYTHKAINKPNKNLDEFIGLFF